MDVTILSDSISLYTPLSTGTSTTTPSSHALSDTSSNVPSPPSLILLCTWQGATPRKIAHYISGYTTLFPTSPILFLRTTLGDMTYRSLSMIQQRLEPARGVLTLYTQSHAPVLLHLLSHGGHATAISLLRGLESKGESLNVRLLVSDCCPGSGTFGETYRAGLASFPKSNQATKIISAATLGGAVATVYTLHHLSVINSIPGLRIVMNDPKDVFGREIRRLYFTSDGDGVFDAEDVVGHAEEAKCAGYDVKVVRFEKGRHCALPVENGGWYWGAVGESWGMGMREDGGRSEVKAKL